MTSSELQRVYDGGQKDIQVTYLSNLTSSGHLTEVWRESKGRLCTIILTSLEGLKWVSVLVLCGRMSCVSFGTSARCSLTVLYGRPQVWCECSIDVHWTSVGPLGNNISIKINNQTQLRLNRFLTPESWLINQLEITYSKLSYEVCSKITIKTLERHQGRHWRHSGVLTLNMFYTLF